MQEIAPNIFIETSFPGVTVGAINRSHGLILIDAPFRPEDIRTWRTTLQTMGGGAERILINLDANYDRTIGTRAMECTIIGNEKMAAVFRNRPLTFKGQSAETGAGWETVNGLGSVRWSPPEITFSQDMTIYWDDNPIIIESHPGPASGSSWVSLPDQEIIFVGDAIIPHQPPFLANADIPQWLETLNILLSEDYKDYLLISSRGGVVKQDAVKHQIDFLEEVQQKIEKLAVEGVEPELTKNLIPQLLQSFEYPFELDSQMQQRLRWGLYQYYARRYRPNKAELSE